MKRIFGPKVDPERLPLPLPPGVEVRECRWLPWLAGILMFRFRPMSAVALGRTIVAYDRPMGTLPASTLAHELVHVAQWEKYGVTLPLRYIWGHIRHGYEDNPYEVEADAAEHNHRR